MATDGPSNPVPNVVPPAAPSDAAPSRRRSWIRRAGFGSATVLLSGVVGLGLIELAVRVLVPVTDVQWWFWDPVLGPRRTPNQSGRYVRLPVINARYHFNKQGWNYPRDYQIQRPSDVAVRVCVVGDSYVEALQVDTDQSLVCAGERAMLKAGVNAQWYGFGCSGFGPSQYYLLLRHYVLDYHPDFVVVLLMSNDVYDSSPYLVPRTTRRHTVHVDDQGRAHLFEGQRFEPSWCSRLLYSTAVGRLLFVQYNLRQMLGRRHQDQPQTFLRDEAPGPPILGDDLPFEQRAALSWEHVERVLRLIDDECRRAGTKLLLVYRGDAMKLRALMAGAIPFAETPKDKDPYCMNERIWQMGPDRLAPMAERLGIPYLDLYEPLAEAVRATGQPHDHAQINDDHYSELGHRVAGERIAAYLLSWVAKPPRE